VTLLGPSRSLYGSVKWVRESQAGGDAYTLHQSIHTYHIVTGAQVTGAQVTGAQVTGAQVTGAQVTGAQVTGAGVSLSTHGSCSINSSKVLPYLKHTHVLVLVRHFPPSSQER